MLSILPLALSFPLTNIAGSCLQAEAYLQLGIEFFSD